MHTRARWRKQRDVLVHVLARGDHPDANGSGGGCYDRARRPSRGRGGSHFGAAGAHFNPAVTWRSRSRPASVSRVPTYVVAQLAGVVLAGSRCAASSSSPSPPSIGRTPDARARERRSLPVAIALKRCSPSSGWAVYGTRCRHRAALAGFGTASPSDRHPDVLATDRAQ